MKLSFLILVVVFQLIASAKSAKYEFDFNSKELSCQIWMKECNYVFVVSDCFSMKHEKYIVYSEQRKLYGFNDFETTTFQDDEIISVDGTYMQKMMCINNTYPGPLIVAYENQILNIRFINKLMGETFTVHFHGMTHKGTNNMDGVHSITQDSIYPDSYYDYQFLAYPHGTYWYHSHEHSFYTLNGPLIIFPKTPTYQPFSEFALMFSDFADNLNAIRDIELQNGQLIFLKPPVVEDADNKTQTLMKNAFDSSRVGVSLKNHCLNGKCESLDEKKQMPLEVLQVPARKSYRLRFINSAGRNSYLISIDKHKFTLISVDGYDVKPVSNVNAVIVNPGERIDVLLQADQIVGNYWIRAQTVQDGCQLRNQTYPRALGILRYDGAPIADPTSLSTECTVDTCLTIGCFKQDQLLESKCLTWDELSSGVDSTINPTSLPKPEQINYLNFDIINLPLTPRFGINHLAFALPHVFKNLDEPFENLAKLHELRKAPEHSCDRCLNVSDPNMRQFCTCYHSLDIKSSFFNYEYFLFSDLNRDLSIYRPGLHEHPVHIHGYHFEVVKYFIPNLLPDNPKNDCSTFEQVEEITCSNEGESGFLKYGCLNALFNVNLTDLSLNLKNPIKKDTIFVPIGGYALVRIKPDNPGVWALHCHNFYHHLGRMTMILNVY